MGQSNESESVRNGEKFNLHFETCTGYKLANKLLKN